MNKTLSDSQGLQISCLATGFYPRHINLTLFRDGQPVDDDQITGGEILPNGDGTYQMRKSLVISKEELCEEHKYNCTMKHLNLEIKLDITYGKEKNNNQTKCHNRFNNKKYLHISVTYCYHFFFSNSPHFQMWLNVTQDPSVCSYVLVFMCVAVLIITALIIWRKRQAAGKCSFQSSSLHLKFKMEINFMQFCFCSVTLHLSWFYYLILIQDRDLGHH